MVPFKPGDTEKKFETAAGFKTFYFINTKHEEQESYARGEFWQNENMNIHR